MLITPNGERVLTSLGFNFARARADETTYFEVMDGISLRQLGSHDLRDPREEFGSPLYTIHRADLLGELQHLASGLHVQMGMRVVAMDAREGLVDLEDGSRHHADLIVAGDGVHSIARAVVLQDVFAAEAVPSGYSAFRFMIPTAMLQDDAHFQKLQKMRGMRSCLFADTTREGHHHLVWFTCRKWVTFDSVLLLRSPPLKGSRLRFIAVVTFKSSLEYTKAFRTKNRVSCKTTRLPNNLGILDLMKPNV